MEWRGSRMVVVVGVADAVEAIGVSESGAIHQS